MANSLDEISDGQGNQSELLVSLTGELLDASDDHHVSIQKCQLVGADGELRFVLERRNSIFWFSNARTPVA